MARAKGTKNKKKEVLSPVEGYQPESSTLDSSNPPTSGSGVPDLVGADSIKVAVDIITKPTEEKKEVKLTKEEKDRKDKLHNMLREINKEHGKDTVKFAKDEPVKEKIPTGLVSIDDFTGGGICVRGNISIVYGGEGTGKSSLVYYTMAQAQKQGLTCAYFDLEHGFNKERAELFGVNLETLVVVEAVDSAEEAMDLVITMAKEKVVDFIAIDSVQAFSCKAENESKAGKERKMEEDEIALLAKKMGKFCRRVGTPIYRGKVALLLVGQSRTGGIGGFATHEELTGGRAQKFWSLLTLFTRKGQSADAPQEKVEINGEKKTVKLGFDCCIKIEKTKVSNSKTELSELHIPYLYKSGFQDEYSYV
jgi:recombination protein RecA